MNDASHKSESDCAVCLQNCNHPTKLPCGHIFCFLCVKGIAFQSKKCAMCRSEIPPNYLDNPVLLGTIPDEEAVTATREEYQWFYEGRNGWWKYDERSNYELETAFNAGETDCTLLLAGTLYNIDFQSMTQIRRSDQTRRRRVRRDSPMFPAKGIAGIKCENSHNMEQIKVEDGPAEQNNLNSEDAVIEISDNEDVEPVSQESDNVNHIVDSISAMNLGDDTPLERNRENT